MTTKLDSVDEAFDEALRRAPGDERANFLDVACGKDTEKGTRVERLLAAYEQADSFLESPAGDSLGGAGDLPLEQPGTMIGPYKLLEQIGEGGMGVVFLAEQQQPVKRKVALKIVKPGMDTREVVGRFEAERQALALMDHPNIAKVFDAGSVGQAFQAAGPTDGPTDRFGFDGASVKGAKEDGGLLPERPGARFAQKTPVPFGGGRPYFVMELVQGVPITEYCDLCNLSTRERLELFVTVCLAVQHAHQKGIIHRDIKPSNVLVAMQDGRATPKIIDFGVAKAMGARLTEHSLTTGFAQMVGTPLYMSPEQAELSPLGVDTRSDIYSLGVLLYELLTGTTPFDRDRLRAAAYDEVRHIIREEEPPRPSTRISTLATAAATTIAEHRHTNPRRLFQTIHGELDWIVMKALEKDRNRRYESASALGRDIERHLHDEPVRACPPSTWYRMCKLARRHRGFFIGTIAASLIVPLGLGALVVSNFLIRREQARTRIEMVRVKEARQLAEDRAEDVRQGMERLKAANVWLERGRRYAGMQRWDDANAAFTNAVELRPDHAAGWIERGELFALLGLWELAKTDFAHEFELREPEVTMRWYRHAVLCLALGEMDAYRLTRERMQVRFRGTPDPHFATEVVRTSVLASEKDERLDALVDLAQRRADGDPGSCLQLYVLGPSPVPRWPIRAGGPAAPGSVDSTPRSLRPGTELSCAGDGPSSLGSDD